MPLVLRKSKNEKIMIIRNLILIAFFTTHLSFTQNGGKNFIDQPYIEVTGQIETEIIPNEIYLNITLNENDKKGKISIEQQENQIITVLKSLQIDIEKNFSILDFNGFYKRKFLADDKVTKKKRYQLIVNDGKTLGKIYQAIDRIDVSNIFITKTSHSNIEKIRRDTKLKALKAAKEKANDYAEAINQTIGKALFIKEVSNFSNNRFLANNANLLNEVVVVGYGSKSKQENIQDLNIKSIIITASVMAKFSLH